MLYLLVLLCNLRVLKREETDYSLHELRFFGILVVVFYQFAEKWDQQ